MASSMADFWRLTMESNLLTRPQCQQLATAFQAAGGPQQGSATPLAGWLVARSVLSRYQARILLGGHAGPFCYGDYKVYDRIEEGRLANWFRAVHATTNHPVLLRFLTGDAARHPQSLAIVQSFAPYSQHPNLQRTFAAVDLGTYRFVVGEDLRGQSLAQRVASGPVPPHEACRMILAAAQGLARLHQLGRAHGDPRPFHLWLDTNGHVKVLFEPEQAPAPPLFADPPSEDLAARVDYLAPEFLQQGKLPDPLTDIYALGCSLYELIAGRPPFAAGTWQQKMQCHAAQAIQPLSNLGQFQALNQVIAYMMAKNPAVRFRQMEQVMQQLAPFANAAPAPPPASPAATLPAFEAALQQAATAAVGARPASGMPTGSVPPAPVGAYAAPPMPGAPPGPAGAAPSGTGPAVAAATGGAAATLRRGRARMGKKNEKLVLGVGIGVAVIVIVGGVYVLAKLLGGADAPTIAAPAASSAPAATEPDHAAQVEPTPPAAALGEQVGNQLLVPDDGQLLWASPTQGQPVELKYVPTGVQVLMFARPADVLANPEGERTVRALGPDFEAARLQWEQAAGVSLAEIERLTAAILPGENGGPPRAYWIVWMKTPVASGDRLAKWDTPPATDVAGLYQRDTTGYYIPPDGGDQVFVMGPLGMELKDMAVAAGRPPLLRREFSRLQQVSDDQRHLTILFAPGFLFGDGRGLFAGGHDRAVAPLTELLGADLLTGLVSLHFADPFYIELRAVSDLTVQPQAWATQFRERMQPVPEAIEAYIARIDPDPYWRRVALRYWQMIQFLHGQMRVGVEQEQAVVNAVLPPHAAHNLFFGGEMVLTATPDVAAVAAAPAAPAAMAAAPHNIDELLKTRMSISFAQDSLDFSLQNIVQEVKQQHPGLPFEFKIRILGDDLKLDGITQNQQIRDFAAQNQTVAEVLTALVMKANPVTTVKEPQEKDQKLLWVVAPDPEKPSNRIVLITTRQVAEGKYSLPDVFRPRGG